MASYCHSKSQQGQWLLRIEDIDTPRVVKGATSQILATLEAYGFEWDGDVLLQSSQCDYYESKLACLLERNHAYACECSRKSLSQKNVKTGLMGQIYPGFCRHKALDCSSHSIRLNTALAKSSRFYDQVFGYIMFNLSQQAGDFIIKRADGVYAYHLAVVLDDFIQNVNQVVRGADLLLSSCLHLYLQQLLDLPTPQYLHIPLVKNSAGEKLSKQTGAKAIETGNASTTLIAALEFLNQPTQQQWRTLSPRAILQQAISHWDHRLIAQRRDKMPGASHFCG